jgi:hydroxyacylglutathione hydrolase
MFGRLMHNQPDPREIDQAGGGGAYDRQSAVFVDVREPEEWAEGRIPGALHIPLGELARRSDEVPAEGSVITVCRSGVRSLEAVDILRAAGRDDVKSLAGGMLDWAKAGREIER